MSAKSTSTRFYFNSLIFSPVAALRPIFCTHEDIPFTWNFTEFIVFFRHGTGHSDDPFLWLWQLKTYPYLKIMRNFISFLVIAALMSMAQVSLASREICLYAPYISSLARVDVKPMDNETYQFNFHMVLDYKYRIRVENVFVDRNNNFLSNESKIFFEKDVNEAPFTEDSVTLGNGETIDLVAGKFSYLEHSKNVFKDYLQGDKLINLAELGKMCSSIFIPEADYTFPISGNGNKFMRVWYHKYNLCSEECSSTESCNPIGISISPIGGVVSAFYKEPFLFELDADGKIYIKKFSPGNYPNETFAKGYHGKLIFSSFFAGPSSALVSSTFCNKLNTELQEKIRDVDPEIVYDQGFYKPFRTVTRDSDGSVVSVESQYYTDKKESWIKWSNRGNDKPYAMNRIQEYDLNLTSSKDSEITSKIWSLDSLSIVSNAEIRAYHFNRQKEDGTVITMGGKNLFLAGSRVSPDDLTHWVRCRKVVQVYGFYYVLIDYSHDDKKNLVKLHAFDEDLFDYHIAALHAEGDEFWIFTKSLTVMLMRADSTRCDILKLTHLKTMHYRQLFNYKSTNYLIEGRYYDIKGGFWSPSWSDTGHSGQIPVLIWPLVIIGLLLTIIIVISLVRSCSCQSSETAAHGEVSYSHHHSGSAARTTASNSKGSAATARPTLPQDNYQATFSDAQLQPITQRDISSVRTIKSYSESNKEKGGGSLLTAGIRHSSDNSILPRQMVITIAPPPPPPPPTPPPPTASLPRSPRSPIKSPRQYERDSKMDGKHNHGHSSSPQRHRTHSPHFQFPIVRHDANRGSSSPKKSPKSPHKKHDTHHGKAGKVHHIKRK